MKRYERMTMAATFRTLLAWLMIFGLLIWMSVAVAQEAAIINTGLSDKTYSPGTHISPVPAIVPPGGSQKNGASIDVTNLTDPTVCVKFMLESSADNVVWEGAGAAGVCGVVGGIKDKAGNPVSSSSFSAGKALPAGHLLRTKLDLTGGNLKTSSGIQMWEIQ